MVLRAGYLLDRIGQDIDKGVQDSRHCRTPSHYPLSSIEANRHTTGGRIEGSRTKDNLARTRAGGCNYTLLVSCTKESGSLQLAQDWETTLSLRRLLLSQVIIRYLVYVLSKLGILLHTNTAYHSLLHCEPPFRSHQLSAATRNRHSFRINWNMEQDICRNPDQSSSGIGDGTHQFNRIWFQSQATTLLRTPRWTQARRQRRGTLSRLVNFSVCPPKRGLWIFHILNKSYLLGLLSHTSLRVIIDC